MVDEDAADGKEGRYNMTVTVSDKGAIAVAFQHRRGYGLGSLRRQRHRSMTGYSHLRRSRVDFVAGECSTTVIATSLGLQATAR